MLPYSFLGIGRSNNYVESFHAATSYRGKLVSRVWTPIIPNSQLIVFANGDDTSEWDLELFISPTTKLYLVVFCGAVSLVVIGVWICALEYNEKQEDRKKREQHFDFF